MWSRTVDAHDGAGLAKARGQGDVVAARGGVPRGVVVEEDDRGRVVGRGRAEDDGGVHQAHVSRIALDRIVVRRTRCFVFNDTMSNFSTAYPPWRGRRYWATSRGDPSLGRSGAGRVRVRRPSSQGVPAVARPRRPELEGGEEVLDGLPVCGLVRLAARRNRHLLGDHRALPCQLGGQPGAAQLVVNVQLSRLADAGARAHPLPGMLERLRHLGVGLHL